MLGSVYAHIFGAANARRDVYELSRRVYEHEDPEFDVDEWVAGAHPLDDHALEHPLVTELVGQDETGPSAALAYMEDMDEDDAGAVIRWMMAGAFKGLFDDEGAFAESEFCTVVEGLIGRAGEDIGFPDNEPFGHFVNWAEVGESLEYAYPQRFQMIAGGGGVFAFDLKTRISQYRE